MIEGEEGALETDVKPAHSSAAGIRHERHGSIRGYRDPARRRLVGRRERSNRRQPVSADERIRRKPAGVRRTALRIGNEQIIAAVERKPERRRSR